LRLQGIEIDEALVRKNAEESKGFSWKNPVWRSEDGSVAEW
jgi:galactonate dehydratase